MFDIFKEFTPGEIIKMFLGAAIAAPICWAIVSIIFLFGGYSL